MLHLVTRRRSFKVASFFTLLFALFTGGAAAATGYQDYREIPEGTDAKRLANRRAAHTGRVRDFLFRDSQGSRVFATQDALTDGAIGFFCGSGHNMIVYGLT